MAHDMQSLLYLEREYKALTGTSTENKEDLGKHDRNKPMITSVTPKEEALEAHLMMNSMWLL